MSTVMEGENRVFLMGKPEDGGECLYLDCGERLLNNLIIRVCYHNAEHVCERHSVWEDGIRVR